MKRMSVMVLPVMLAGCATTGGVEPLETYLGENIEAATAILGEPTAAYDMQDGTWQYTWTEHTGYQPGAIALGGVQLTQPETRNCTRVLITDTQRIVIGYKYEGSC